VYFPSDLYGGDAADLTFQDPLFRQRFKVGQRLRGDWKYWAAEACGPGVIGHDPPSGSDSGPVCLDRSLHSSIHCDVDGLPTDPSGL